MCPRDPQQQQQQGGQPPGQPSACRQSRGSSATAGEGAGRQSKALPADLVAGLGCTPKTLPCRFLYDKRGSQLYEQITQLEEYYPFAVEARLLAQHASDIARHIPPGSVVVELGVGAGDKTALLLRALLECHGPDAVHFAGIDCSAEALRQARATLLHACPALPPSRLALVEAEYLEGVAAVRAQHPHTFLTLLWLGSSVGNFAPGAAAAFLRRLVGAAGERSQLLLCTDLWKDEAVLHAAYDDPQGVTEAFIKNGLAHALRTLGVVGAAAEPSSWEYEAVVNWELQQVELYLTARAAVPEVLPGVGIAARERVLVEVSRKFTPDKVAGLAHRAGLCLQASWGDSGYLASLLLRPREALLRCWQDTDSLFSSITDWQAQPIGLRHPFGFYYGHCAAFARLKMLPQEKDAALDVMLSRGIDPLVLDPSRCHTHPAVPNAWPTKQQLLEYVAQMRAKLLGSLSPAGDAESEAQAAAAALPRELCMSLEHERMHQETLCYMLAQQCKLDYLAQHSSSKPLSSAGAAGQRAPPVVVVPSASCSQLQQQTLGSSSQEAAQSGVEPFYLQHCSYASATAGAATAAGPVMAPGTPAKQEQAAQGAHSDNGDIGAGGPAFVEVLECQVQLGLDASASCGFRWDNELTTAPAPRSVPPFLLAAKPVTVAQFREFVVTNKGYERPELWDAADWGWLVASGQRMPATWSPDLAAADPEAEPVVHMPEASYPWRQMADCPAYVSLAEALAYCRHHGARMLSEAEYAAACQHAKASGGIAALWEGGWEWTASLLEPFPGFAPDELYQEYSTDFFDGCHYVLKGGSPYTHPSTRRASFRNFYQRQYPFVFAKFRLARDVASAE